MQPTASPKLYHSVLVLHIFWFGDEEAIRNSAHLIFAWEQNRYKVKEVDEMDLDVCVRQSRKKSNENAHDWLRNFLDRRYRHAR